MVRPARSLLTEDEIAFIAYLKELIAQGVIREEDPFPEDVEPVVEDDEGYEDEVED